MTYTSNNSICALERSANSVETTIQLDPNVPYLNTPTYALIEWDSDGSWDIHLSPDAKFALATTLASRISTLPH